MYDTGQGIAGEADTIDTFLSIAQSILGSPPPQPYQITQVTSGNPLYSTDNQGYVATMDFGAVNFCTPALTGPVDRIVLLGMPAATNVNGTNISINTIVVTNAGYIASPSLDVSFPPNINVFFADNVNTNASQLRVEGNIGFIPLADTNISFRNQQQPGGTLAQFGVLQLDGAVHHNSPGDPGRCNQPDIYLYHKLSCLGKPVVDLGHQHSSAVAF